jgi:hypothetical protein
MSLARPEINAKDTTNQRRLRFFMMERTTLRPSSTVLLPWSPPATRSFSASFFFWVHLGIIASNIVQLPACRRALDFGIRSLSLAYPFSGMGIFLLK